MPFAIKITTFVNKTQVTSYLVEVKDKEIITSPRPVSYTHLTLPTIYSV